MEDAQEKPIDIAWNLALEGNLEEFKLFFKTLPSTTVQNLFLSYRNGATLLSTALAQKKKETVNFLLENGAVISVYK